jgi:pSer/pThr/pTyr-binding forkhead associated (FHA) protein
LEYYDIVPEFSLVIESGGERGERFTFQQPEITLGRTADNDLVLYDAAVSRRHLVVYYRNQQFIIEDLGSSNGTVVNGYKLTQPSVLSEGDFIDVGPVRFVFTLSEDAGDSTNIEAEIIPEPWVNPDPSAPIARPRIDPASGMPAPPQGDTRAFAASYLQQAGAPIPQSSATQQLPAQHAPNFPPPSSPRPPLPKFEQPAVPFESVQHPFAPPPAQHPFAPPPAQNPFQAPPSGIAPAPPSRIAPAPPSGIASAPPSAAYPNPMFPPASPARPSPSGELPQSRPLAGNAPLPMAPMMPASISLAEPEPRLLNPFDAQGFSPQQERSYVKRLSFVSLLFFACALLFFLLPLSPQSANELRTPNIEKAEPIELSDSPEVLHKKTFGFNQYNRFDQRYLFGVTFRLPNYKDGHLYLSFRLISPDHIDIVINGTTMTRLSTDAKVWLPYRIKVDRGLLLGYSPNLIAFRRVSAAENRWGLTHLQTEEIEIPRHNLVRAEKYCDEADKIYPDRRSKPEDLLTTFEKYTLCERYLFRKSPPPNLLLHARKRLKSLQEELDALFASKMREIGKASTPQEKIAHYRDLLRIFHDSKSAEHMRAQEALQGLMKQ